ncbi:MAG: M13 family metallopeptidase [Prevotellaceae bacterium]|nr:M13 family metallopeptidase [Prevotellaceae bacterium]
MHMKQLFPVAMLCLLTASCNNGKPSDAGIDLANLDTSVAPGTDFYQFACGGWIASHPLPAEFSKYGSFTVLDENNTQQIQGLIQELAGEEHEPGSIAQKVGDLYQIAMDSVRLNQEGIEPIRAELEHIAALVENPSSVYTLLGELQKVGVVAYTSVRVDADDMNSKENAVQTYQAGLSMREREYYLEDDSATVKIREAFKAYIPKMFSLAGFDEATAQQAAEVVMDVETRLATAYRSRVDLRDPYANYNKMSMKEVKALSPAFNWDAFLAAMDLNGVTEIIVGQPASLKAAADIVNTLPAQQQALYLQWKLIDAAAGFLSDDLAAERFDFYSRTMNGVQEMQPRWKRAIGTMDRAIGEAIGQMYVEKYFPAASKERMVALVENLRQTLGERIQNLTWMSDTTKVKALEKLSTFRVKIGYPDQWKDYSALEINKEDSFWENMKRASLWEHARMVDKVGKPVDPEEWFMTPQTVNAYYNPTTNEICFPAGILQYPFFDMSADDAFNYGAIGVVIGHEMTHGFDDEGRQYDKDGNLKDWWTADDAASFEQRAKVMSDFFDNIEVAPGVHANGRQTLGENIADYGGLQVAYQAFKKATAEAPLADKEGFTPEQRFFLAYAGVWANTISPEAVLSATKSDSHALAQWRVNGALPQIDAWYEAFGIEEGDPMYLAPEDRVSIW